MKKNNARRIFACSMIVLIGMFYLLAMPVTIYWYDLPNISIISHLKYIALKTTEILYGKLTFVVDVPDGIYTFWKLAGWQGTTKHIPAYGYAEFFEKMPNGWIYISSLYWFPATFVISLVIALTSKKQAKTHIRGSEKVTAKELSNSLRKSGDVGIAIGELCLPRSIEARHFLILGTTGTGKSYLLMSMIAQFQQRRIRMIIFDRKGEFYSVFGQPNKDIFFNPYDQRHENWTAFSEFGIPKSLGHIPEQLRDLADSLFSVSPNNHNAHFYHAAADVFCSSMCYLALAGKTSNADIRAFFAAGGAQIVTALKTLPAGLADGLAHLGKDGTDEHSGSILSTLTERCKDFAAFVGKDGDFSVRDWIREGHGNLFINTAGANDERYRSVITMLLDIIGQEIKAMPETGTTQLAIVIDELASLPPLKTLSFLLNEGRSKGVCVILANQTFSKIREIYGEAGAKNIFANANTKFIFRLPEPGDAKYISDAIGEQEIKRYMQSENETTRGLWSCSDSRGTTTSEQIVREAVYLPSQIQNLKKRCAITLLPDVPIAEVMLPEMSVQIRHSLFSPASTEEVSAKEIAATVAHTSTGKPVKEDLRL